MIQPCCGYSLQNGTKIIAIIEIVLSALYLFHNLTALATYAPLALDERNDIAENPTEKNLKINSMISVLLLLNTSFWISSLFLAILLLIGARQRDLRKCRQWFVITCILTVLYIVEILMEAFSMRASGTQISSPVVGSLLQIYMLWVVSSFMDELRLGGCVPIKSLTDVGV